MKTFLVTVALFAIIAAMHAEPPFAEKIDEAVRTAIEQKKIPGAVIVVGSHGKIIFRKAYGQRALEPKAEPMTEDTIFDLASLTKPLATGLAAMKLIEQGKLHLDDRVGIREITVQQLLTHTSGLPSWDKPENLGKTLPDAITAIAKMKPRAPAGTEFIYSDLGFITLGEIVARAAGEPLDEFCLREIYQPLGLKHTRFKPPADWIPLIAPTEKIDGEWRRGVVHDPNAFHFGGVTGHAGLFSTAEEVGKLAQLMLDGGKPIFSAATIKLMTAPMTATDDNSLRGLSWDILTDYSGLKSKTFSPASFGHTGFTGTSVWIDPRAQLYIVILTNAIHVPKSETRPLRRAISDAVAESLCAPTKKGETKTGLDVLVAENFKRLEGRNVALIINHTSVDRRGKHILDILPPNVKVVTLLTPEHGLRGATEEFVTSGKDGKTGLPFFSLYTQQTKRPTDEMLRGVDTLVFDIQDIGVRFYTYSTTMCNCLEEAAKRKMKFIVLDRPNPIGGQRVEGPVLDKGARSFIAAWELPLKHGLTLGELATLYNAEENLHADLEVVRCENWERGDWFDETGLPWVNPSPNIRNLHEAILYPCVGALENTNLSVGRGTDTPFEHFGAPFIDGIALAKELNALNLTGIRFYPVRFTPNASKYKGEECGGVFLTVLDREKFRPVRTSAAIATVLHRLYPAVAARDERGDIIKPSAQSPVSSLQSPAVWQFDHIAGMFGTRAFQTRLAAGDTPQQLEDAWRPALENFLAVRAKYLLY